MIMTIMPMTIMITSSSTIGIKIIIIGTGSITNTGSTSIWWTSSTTAASRSRSVSWHGR
jgi:hypothetical protein